MSGPARAEERATPAPPPVPRAPPRARYLLPLLAFLSLALLFLLRLPADPSRLPSAMVGRPAPALTLPPLPGLARDGAPVPGLDPASLAPGAAPGRVTLVNVFASWCAPCREEHPLLMRLAADPAVRLVGIDTKDEPDQALRFLRGLGNPYAAVGVDRDGRAAIEWGAYGVPETFVIDAEGRVRHRHAGPLTEASLARALAAAR